MKKQKVTKWNPSHVITHILHFTGLVENGEILTVVLETDSGFAIRFKFKSALTYRVSDEGDRLKIIDHTKGFEDWPLYLVENSEFLQWYNDESYNVRVGQGYFHCLIWTSTVVVDVIALEFPEILPHAE